MFCVRVLILLKVVPSILKSPSLPYWTRVFGHVIFFRVESKNVSLTSSTNSQRVLEFEQMFLKNKSLMNV